MSKNVVVELIGAVHVAQGETSHFAFYFAMICDVVVIFGPPEEKWTM